MADKVDRPKKKAKPKKDEKGVLAALPSTRLERIGNRRAAAATKPSAAPKRGAATSASATAAATKTAGHKHAARTASRGTAARPKPAAPSTSEPTQAAAVSFRSSPRPADATAPRAETGPATEPGQPRPRPVREGAPGIGTHAPRGERSPESARPSGAELASTAVKAAGEVAQLGVAIGGQVLKRVVDRIPKP